VKDNIKLDLKATGLGSVDWINLVQDIVQWRSFVSMVKNLRFSYDPAYFLNKQLVVSQEQLHLISWLIGILVHVNHAPSDEF
jgi:hypothetical protein